MQDLVVLRLGSRNDLVKVETGQQSQPLAKQSPDLQEKQ